jgi:hypothetical protein
MSKHMKAYQENDSTNTRLAVLESIAEQTSQTLIRLEKKIDDGFEKSDKKMDQGFRDIRNEIDQVRQNVIEVRKENTSHFRTTIFTLLTLIGAPLMLKSIEIVTNYAAKM